MAPSDDTFVNLKRTSSENQLKVADLIRLLEEQEEDERQRIHESSLAAQPPVRESHPSHP